MSVIAHTFSVSSVPEKVLKENNRKFNLKRSRGSSPLLPKSCIGSAQTTTAMTATKLGHHSEVIYVINVEFCNAKLLL